MKKVEVKGTIVTNDDKWIYDWFAIEAVCPRDIIKALQDAGGGNVVVEVNSGGGDVFAGNEIYYALTGYQGGVTVDIVGFAGSAATMICCAGQRVRAVPGAMYMIHNVSGGAQGDYHVMDQQSGILQIANKSIANAYRLKTGLSEKALLALMDKESWMDAKEAQAKGFIDEIIGDNGTLMNAGSALYNTGFTTVLSQDVLEKIRNTVKRPANYAPDFLMQQNQAKLALLKLRGEIRNV